VADLAAAALTPDGTALDTLSDDGLAWQRVSLAGGVETRSVRLAANAGGSDSGMDSSPSLGTLADGRPLVVAYGDRLGVRARVLRGGDPYRNASWTAWRATPRTGGLRAQTGCGPNGTWALTSGYVTGPFGYRLWKWNGRRFAKPRSLGTIGGRATSNRIGGTPAASVVAPAFAQDAGGRLHAVWNDVDECGARACLFYRRNEPRGFGPPIVYPLPSTHRAFALSIAANAGGSGWIVWSDNNPLLRAPDHAVALVTPPRGSRVGSLRIRRLRVTVPTHYGCIPAGGRFIHRLLVSGRRSGVRIVSVAFSFDDGQLARTDRRPPFRVVYRLPFAAATRHVARADVTYRIGRRTGHASVGRMIVMCP
jgi:hypothetical protein